MVSFDVDSAGAGDIISVAGLKSPSIGHTVAHVEVNPFHTPPKKLTVFGIQN